MLPGWKLLADTRQQKIFDNSIVTQAMWIRSRSFYLPSLRRRLARSCSGKPRFWLLGRNAAERAQKFLLRLKRFQPLILKK